MPSQDTKSEERGEEGHQEDYSGVGRRGSVFDQMKNIPTAGMTSASPRRHSLRRNSVSTDNNTSQIDLGGSQDNLHLLGRNPDKEMKTHTGRASSGRAGGGGPGHGGQFMDNRELEEMEQQSGGGGGGGGKMSVRMDGGGLEAAAEAARPAAASSSSSSPLASEKVSFADLRKQKAKDQFNTSGIKFTYNADGRYVDTDAVEIA